MATITFTAQIPGTENAPVTRTSGTMPYVATVEGVTWHKTFAAAYAAAKGRQHAPGAKVYPVVPTAINGKIDGTEFTEGWGDIPAEAFTELVAAKLAPKAKKAKATAQIELPTEVEPAAEPEAEIVTEPEAPEADVQAEAETEGTVVEPAPVADDADAKKAARRARRAERRLAKRAAESPEDKAARLQARRERRAARKAAAAE
ncbi:hypothetical protein Hosp_095 [Mycobacterium phage Hosp]|uniref:hypothetical protein n=1 Tax=Mycobacterium phage 39HC TaxID=1463809 RepID=UPI0003F1CF42|nr:hypothetical protein CG91_gp100 [Mycobacterium phage 39HC]YP_009032321.1 hypothetical protein FH38_gp95 [Mycobacterium phage Hosp]AHJ88400.1 hypothetical protein 39HC_0100 [Mycobacterium phage 39HC]AHJ88500.1 hypothetical protein 40BC_0100 [Mycobacterium phage 40BC]AHK12049.1 hypothetical protein Hosp_095 [Mycobacterium phage Hosp]